MIFLPASIVATPLGGFRNQVDWEASATEGVTYILDRSLLGDFTDAVNAYTGTALTFTDERGVIDGKCYFRIRASLAGEFSGYRYAMSDNTIDDGNTGDIVNIFGDSITAGTDAAVNYGYAQQLDFHFTGNPDGAHVIGLGGFTITPNTVYNAWDPETGNGQPGWIMPAKTSSHRFCILAYGLNDCNSEAAVTDALYQAAIEDFIDFAIASKGWTAERIIILGPFRGTGTSYTGAGGTFTEARRIAFVAAARAAALSRGAAFLSSYEFEVEAGIFPPDTLHPNTAQHAQIAAYDISHMTSTDAELPPDDPGEPIINLPAGAPAVVVAKQNISFADAGITADNMYVIYLVGNPIISYIPGREINGITGFEINKGYYVVAKQDLDLTAILLPPLAEDE